MDNMNDKIDSIHDNITEIKVSMAKPQGPGKAATAIITFLSSLAVGLIVYLVTRSGNPSAVAEIIEEVML